MCPVYISSFTVLINSIRNGNTMVFSEFSRLNYAYIVDTDKRDLLMVVEEIRHTESQNSEFF